MKKTLMFGLFVLLIGAYITQYVSSKNFKENAPQKGVKEDHVLPAENEYKEPSIAFAWFLVTPDEKIELFSNLDTKTTSHDAKTTHSCEQIVNAGFYSKENEHIGLFKNHTGIISNYQTNQLFNGILLKDFAGNFGISQEATDGTIMLQTGPILIENGQPLELKLKSDKLARRIVAAITQKGDLIFFVFYDSQSVFNGPYLRELPQLVVDASNDFDLGVVDAINLDGGSASSFITDNVNLRELSPIGGFFCINGTETS